MIALAAREEGSRGGAKIEEDEDKAMGKNNWLVKHQSGRRHWKVGIVYVRGKTATYAHRGKKDWAEIETLINGSSSPVNNSNPNDAELTKLKIIFQKLNIKKITFENGKLTIEFNNHQTNSVETITDNQEYSAIAKYCQEHNKKELTSQELNITSANNSANSTPNNNNRQLLIGLALGVGVVVLVGIMVYFARKRKNR